ncbi:MAG: glycosyltransferase family 39 protein [bacterium]
MKNPRGLSTSGTRLIPISVIFFLVVLGGLWLWCSDGSPTSIRIVANGGHFTVFIDDREVANYTEEASSKEGGIALFRTRSLYWGVPMGQRIVAVRVTDNDSGRLLLEQDFNLPLKPIWVERAAKLPAGRLDRLYGGASFSRLSTGYREWVNYTVEFKVRDPLDLGILLRYQDNDNYVRLTLRPFREIDAGLAFVTEGKTLSRGVDRPYYKTEEIVMNVMLLFLYYVPHFLIALAAIILIFCLNRLFASMLNKNYYRCEVLFLIILFLGSCGYLLWINYYILDHIPHVQDSVVYNFQAQLLSRGRLSAPIPPVPQAFALESFIIFKGGNWFGQYPFGHPFLLMFGHLVDAPWIVPPLVGAAVLILIYLIARELFSRKVAVVASLIALSSPLFQMNASNFMSHSSASFYLALAVLFLIRACNGQVYSCQKLYAFLSGLSLGLLFNTRPFNALPVIALSGSVLIYFLL